MTSPVVEQPEGRAEAFLRRRRQQEQVSGNLDSSRFENTGADSPGPGYTSAGYSSGHYCPPGLEYLTQIDQLIVQQTVEIFEAVTGFETQNRFHIKNSLGQKVYYAAEESAVCNRMCCGSNRDFRMHVYDNNGQEVMKTEKEWHPCGGCCCGTCCPHYIKVEAPVGNVLGYITQECSLLVRQYIILDEDKEPILRIIGPNCSNICNFRTPCWDLEYKLCTMEGREIGQITRQWSGLWKELFTNADNFGIQFPVDLAVKVKGILFGAVFLINILAFEGSKHQSLPGVVLGGLYILNRCYQNYYEEEVFRDQLHYQDPYGDFYYD